MGEEKTATEITPTLLHTAGFADHFSPEFDNKQIRMERLEDLRQRVRVPLRSIMLILYFLVDACVTRLIDQEGVRI